MKILTWNCNGAFRKKIDLLKSIEADIYIIQECENSVQAKGAYEKWLPNMLWKGFNKNKGLAVFAKDEYRLEALDWDDNKLELFLPIKINSKFNLLATWTKYANSPTFQYIGQMWKYLQLNKDLIAKEPIIIAGDWNSNTKWDVWDRWWNHSDVVKELESLDIHSLYHRFFNENQGEESYSTFFMNRNPDKNYHIDYLFSSYEIFNNKSVTCSVFPKDYWLNYSDHIPILFNIEVLHD